MKEFILEQPVRQNWTSKLKIYESGLGVIENIHHSTKKTTRVWLNAKTTEKFYNSLFMEHITTFTPTNKFTAFLCKIGFVKIDIKSEYIERKEK